MSQFGDRLATALRDRGMSQRELARRIGVDAGWLNRRMNSSQEPRLDPAIYERIAAELGILAADLLPPAFRDRLAGELSAGTQGNEEMGRSDKPTRASGAMLAADENTRRFLIAIERMQDMVESISRELGVLYGDILRGDEKEPPGRKS